MRFRRDRFLGSRQEDYEFGRRSRLDFRFERISTSDTVFEVWPDGCYRATTNQTYLADGDATPTVQKITRERLSGFASGVKSQITTINVDGLTNVQTTAVDRPHAKLAVTTTSTASSLAASQVWSNGLLQSLSSFTVSTPTLFSYDALRRPVRTVSPAGAASSLTYDGTAGQVTSSNDFAGNTTSFQYYPNGHTNAGLLKSVTRADGKRALFSYNSRGQLLRTWGDVPYPEERAYNDYGELVELHTYRGGTGWNGDSWPASPGTADVTAWSYAASTGLLLSKTDAAGHTVTNQYYTNGTPRSRTWARGVSVTNLYSSAGDLAGLNYSDSTPGATFTNYNRAGQPRTVLDALGQRSLAYDAAGRLLSDAGASGLLNGFMVTNHFNLPLGRDSLELWQSGSPVLHHGYTYDTYGRLGGVSADNESIVYAYAPNCDRLGTTTFQHNGGTVLTTARTWLYDSRLQSIANTVSNSPVTGHQYWYDTVNRRTRAILEDGSFWAYGYNNRDEVTSGKRYWDVWTPTAGQQFEYSFDNTRPVRYAVGSGWPPSLAPGSKPASRRAWWERVSHGVNNRSQTKTGGDPSGRNLRLANYTNNNLHPVRCTLDRRKVAGRPPTRYPNLAITADGHLTG